MELETFAARAVCDGNLGDSKESSRGFTTKQVLMVDKGELIRVDGKDKHKAVVADALYDRVLELLKTVKNSLLLDYKFDYQHVNWLEKFANS